MQSLFIYIFKTILLEYGECILYPFDKGQHCFILFVQTKEGPLK